MSQLLVRVQAGPRPGWHLQNKTSVNYANYPTGSSGHTVYLFEQNVALQKVGRTVEAVTLPSLGSVAGYNPATARLRHSGRGCCSWPYRGLGSAQQVGRSMSDRLGDDRSERISGVGADNEVAEAAFLPTPQDLLGGRRRVAREYEERVRLRA